MVWILKSQIAIAETERGGNDESKNHAAVSVVFILDDGEHCLKITFSSSLLYGKKDSRCSNTSGHISHPLLYLDLSIPQWGAEQVVWLFEPIIGSKSFM